MVRSRASLVPPVVATLVAGAAACGGYERAPGLRGQPAGDDGGADATPSLLGSSGPVLKSCGTGPDGGVCACADEPLVLDPPTLYFVLDHSGSMIVGDKWTTVRDVIGSLAVGLGPRAKFGAAVFPAAAAGECAPGGQIFPPSYVGAPTSPPVQGDGAFGQPGPVDTGLIDALGRIVATGGTPTAATLEALLPIVQGFGGKTYVVLATDGGPNCDAAASCTSAMCTLNIESDNSCTPTGPNCCDPANSGSWTACLDAQPTIDAVTAFASAGIPVYVVGVPGSEPYAQLLDQLAIAGGTARGSEPQYYAVSTYDQQALASAMSKIAAQVTGSCTLTLDHVPPVPDQVNVFLDGSALPQAGPDGWTLSGTTVTVLGTSCQAILDGNVIDVRVVAGCPTVAY